MTYVLTFAEGILTFISPCILPMLPVYLLYLAGTPAGQDGGTPSGAGTETRRSRNRLMINSLGFVTGFMLVFVAMGAAAAMMGSLLQRNRPVLLMISGAFMILFGLNFTGVIRIGFLDREKRFSPKLDNLRFPGSVLFGIAFGFGWSPCLGTFLGSALALAGSSETVAEGMLMLLVYSAGLAIPFVVSAAIFENVKSLLGWFSRNSRTIRVVSGILLIAAGVWFFRNGLVLALA